MSEQEITLQSCIDDALAELDDRIEDGLLDEPYPDDALHEIADSHVPIYTADVFTVAANSPDARYPGDDPDRGAEGVIQVAIYERIYEALVARMETAIEERDDAELEDA